jgi:hypothetical protein
VPSTTSISPDITEALPSALGSASGSGALADPSAWDVTFSNLGFNLAITKDKPYLRGTEQVRKDQIDTSESAGEQSLSSYWVRSQDSWDRGGGIRWYEPGSELETVNRYADSQGIDVWTRAQFSLLPSMAAVGTASAVDVFVAGLSVSGVSGYVKATGSAITWHPSTGTVVTAALADDSATQPAAAGGIVWAGHDGGVSKFNPATGVVTATYTCTGIARVWWVKARLIVALGAKLYECTPGGTGVIEAVGTLLYTHPQSTWVWTDVAETGSAILASGYADNDSALFRFTLEQDENNMPVLSGGSQVAHMPPGERVTCMGTYLGAYIVLGTSAGVRVGFINDAGSVQYGALTVELANPAQDVTFHDRFAYVAVTNALPSGHSGAVRIDLSSELHDNDSATTGTGTGRYAHAWDVSATVTGAATSVALVGTRVVLAAARTVYLQSATDLVASGWLDTGRIRFHTVEPKAFRRVRLVAALNGGKVLLTAITPTGNEHRVIEFAEGFATDSDTAIQIPGSSLHQYLSFKVTLTKDDADETSPVISGLVVKAVPAASRVRLYQYPLVLQDFIGDRHGEIRGQRGDAYLRLSALEAMEETGSPERVTDNRTGESFTGQIDAIDFSSTAPPDNEQSGFGGVAVVTVRRL